LYGVHHKSQIEIPSRLLQDIIVWRDWIKPCEMVWISARPKMIRPGYLWNTSVQHYLSVILAGRQVEKKLHLNKTIHVQECLLKKN
jgi:hypothetical protein